MASFFLSNVESLKFEGSYGVSLILPFNLGVVSKEMKAVPYLPLAILL